MQKKLIAVAVAALAAGSAFAQSNVTIYGRINSYVEHIGNSSPAAGTAQADTLKRTRVTNNSSNIGFRGEEDLGNGLKAWFQVESDVSVSDGGSWTGRNSGVGLKGSWGNVMMGSWDAYYADHLRATGMGLAYGFAASDLAVLNHISSSTNGNTASFGPTRARNQIRYTLPNISGFSGYVAYSAGNANLLTSSDNIKTAAGADEKTWVANANYNNGPIFASLSWFATDDYNSAATDTRRSGWKLAGSYDFATGTHLGLTFEDLKAKQTGQSIKKKAWVVNVSQNFGAANVGLYYGVAGDIKGTTGATITAVNAPNANSGAKYIALQGDYALSKRTVAYAGYARIRNESAAQYDFFGGVGAGGATGGAAAVSAGSKPTSFWLGVSHAF